MKKVLTILFLTTSIVAFSEESNRVINQEISGTNKQQLDVKEIDTEELILQNQNLESTSVDIPGEAFKENEDKVVVKQTDDVKLKEELSQGVENKSYLKYILGGIGVAALIIAL